MNTNVKREDMDLCGNNQFVLMPSLPLTVVRGVLFILLESHSRRRQENRGGTGVNND